MTEIEELEYYDKIKSKIIRYILFKKRTEQEVINKFKEIDETLLAEVIEELKSSGYINDKEYIIRAINEFMNLKNLSVKELTYKLYSKGISKDFLDEYIQNNIENLEEYEIQSARRIYIKKINNYDKDEFNLYLLKKGYKKSTIKQILESEE